MKVLPDPDKLCVLLEHIDDKFLDDQIQGEKSPEKLSGYLKWKYDRIIRKLSKRQDFAIKKLFDSKECTPHLKKKILKWSLLIQNTNDEFISCIKCFNEELKNLRLGEKEKLCGGLEELLNIAEVILIVNKERQLEILMHVDKENLKTLLLELANMKLNSEYHINVPSLFLSYFDEIFIRDPEIVDSVVFFLIDQENLDFLSVIFDKRLSVLVESGCFQTNCLWNLLKNCISDENSIKRKQALYILSSTIEFLKNNDSNVRPEVLKSNSPDDWNIYFILLHLSREKQLHLIKPTLKLLESVAHLHIYWRSCLYKILLNHSQLFVVYKTVEYLMDLAVNKTENLLFVLKNVMNALNKYEYSDLSLNAYSKFGIVCNTLPSEYLVQVFEEFISLEWNPVAAWCFLSSVSSLLYKVPQRCISDILHKLKSLPHIYMRNNCIYTFLQNLFKNRENNIIGDLLEIGNILLFEDTDIHKNLFKNVVKMNKRKLEENKSLLLENIIDLIDKNNEKKIHVYLEIMEILQLPLDSSINIPCSVIGDILLLHFPKSKSIKTVLDFLLIRFECDDDCEFHYLSKYLDNLFLNQGDVKEITVYTEKFNEKVDKLWDISRNNISKTLIAMKFLSQTDYYDNVKQMKKLERRTEYYENVITHSHKFWIEHTFKYSLKSNHYENYIILMEKLKDLLDFEIEHSVHLVVESLEVLLNCCTTNERIVESLFIYEKCLKKICKLPSATLRSYSVVFFRSIFCLELFSNTEFVECWKRWVAQYFEDYFFESEIVMKVILEGCHKLIRLEAPTVDIFIPLILRGLLCGLIVQKKQRVEYGICQDIYRINNKFLENENPNIISMNIKMLSIESLYLLAKYHHGKISRLIVTMLLNLYKGHYRTRYFPDSKIHFEKLRIVQALLLVGPCSKESQDELITFIFNSFYEESHQASVKRLLQWLLIILILSDPFKHLEVMIEKLNISSLSHPSFLVALIPVVYHVVLVLNSAKVWFQVSEVFLPLAMGANFKLRVYSQIILKMLLEKANERKITEYITKFSFLESSLSNVLGASGDAVEQTLKNDLRFIESFDYKLHYSIENIFINFPKMLDVQSSEWKNILEYKFSNNMDIRIRNDQEFLNVETIDKTNKKIETISEGINLQKKIIPWRSIMEENNDSKTLGNIICVASLLEKAANLGGLSRTCEIFSVKQLVLHNWKIKEDKEFKNLSMSSENWVDIMEVKRENLSEFLIEMKQQGYSLIGLEQTSESKKLNEFKFQEKTVLLLGNEKEGIPAPLLPLMTSCVEIPQYGQTRSLNVHVAGAIFLWEYVRQYREELSMSVNIQ